MTLTALICPRCSAPVDAAKSGLARCHYCGATLVSSVLDAAPLPPAAEAANNLGFLDIFLDEVGPSKISVIAAVREHLHLGLKDAKDLVEKAPCALAQAMEGGSAKSFLAALAKAGAKVRST